MFQNTNFKEYLVTQTKFLLLMEVVQLEVGPFYKAIHSETFFSSQHSMDSSLNLHNTSKGFWETNSEINNKILIWYYGGGEDLTPVYQSKCKYWATSSAMKQQYTFCMMFGEDGWEQTWLYQKEGIGIILYHFLVLISFF